MIRDTITEAVLWEAQAAQNKYGDFASAHEALGVLLEEVEELRDAIRANVRADAEKEAMQVAAVAYRLYWHLAAPNTHRPFIDRSGMSAEE